MLLRGAAENPSHVGPPTSIARCVWITGNIGVGMMNAMRHYPVDGPTFQGKCSTESQKVFDLLDSPFNSLHHRIEPSKGFVSLRIGELWSYRELLYFLIWRDVKVRYKQTALGVAWAVIQPVMTMVVFSVFFGKLAKLPSDGVP